MHVALTNSGKPIPYLKLIPTLYLLLL